MTTNNNQQVVDIALLNEKIDAVVRDLTAVDVDDPRFDEIIDKLIKKIAALSEQRAALRKNSSNT